MANVRFRIKELISDLGAGSQNLKVSTAAAETIFKTAQNDGFATAIGSGSASGGNSTSGGGSGGSSSAAGGKRGAALASSGGGSGSGAAHSEVEQILMAVTATLENEKEPSLCVPLISALAIIVKSNRGMNSLAFGAAVCFDLAFNSMRCDVMWCRFESIRIAHSTCCDGSTEINASFQNGCGYDLEDTDSTAFVYGV